MRCEYSIVCLEACCTFGILQTSEAHVPSQLSPWQSGAQGTSPASTDQPHTVSGTCHTADTVLPRPGREVGGGGVPCQVRRAVDTAWRAPCVGYTPVLCTAHLNVYTGPLTQGSLWTELIFT